MPVAVGAPVAAAPAPAVVATAAPPAEPVAALAVPQLLAATDAAPARAAATAAPVLLAAAPARTPVPVAVAEPRFDLSVNSAPAAQVFLQLVNGTSYNMLVSPEVSGTLSITLKDTTVAEAMDTLRELFGYEYRITGNRIFVYPNTVQTRLYKVNYLPGRRQGASDTRVTSSAITLGGSSSTSGSGGGNGSSGNPQGSSNGSGNGGGNNGNRADDSAHVRTTSDADFWREVQNSLTALVGVHGGRSVVLNPAAGVVVVKATPAELRQVENYLKAVQLSIERQVMLEAKIVEVQLTKDAQTGINWAGFGKLGSGQVSIGSAAPGSVLGTTGNLSSNDGTTIAPGVNLAAGALGRGFYGLAFQAANFAALLNFLQTQGDVQVLSSPRIATLNNQKAVLKVGSDELYVTGVSSSTTSSGASQVTTPTLTLQPFFSGISLDVTPQIDEAGNVMLHVHPTISLVTEKNKFIDLGSLGAFKLPLASSAVNETDSIVRVKDGQIVAIGGLMKQESRDERTGLPVVSDAPVVGSLFRQTSTVTSKRELVIMLKPTVIRDDGVWPDAPAFGAPTPQAAPARP
jgi:MSHA biogenesis protein MshL